MRRRAKAEGFEQMAELVRLLFGIHSEDIEEAGLQFALVNSDRAAAEFHAVQDDIVGHRAHCGVFALFHKGHVLRFWTGEGMMHGHPFVFLGAERKQREIHDPEKVQGVGFGGEAEEFRATQPDAAQHFAHGLPAVRAKEQHIAFDESQPFREGGLFRLAEELHDGRFPFAARRSI